MHRKTKTSNASQHRQRSSPIDRYSRRDLLRLGAGALGTAALSPLARRGSAAPRFVPSTGPKLVVVNLKGGNDGLNTLVPNHLSTYFERRPGLALHADGSDPTLSLDAGPWPDANHRLHPALGYLASAYAAGDLAIVRKVGYPDANESHFESETIYSRARRDVTAVGGAEASGWIARLVDAIDPRPTAAIAVGAGALEDFRGGSTPLLSIGSWLDGFRFEVDNPYWNTNDPHRKATVKSMLEQFSGHSLATQVRDAELLGHELEESVRLADENYVSDVVYPWGSLSTSLQTVAKLVQGGFETRVFYVTRGGYDTHGAQTWTHYSLHTQMDEALAAFAQDLAAMGVWDDVVIVVISEFGRRNSENGSGGTDHGAASSTFVLGGAVTGGLYGAEMLESDLLLPSLPYATDFRSIYKEIAAAHFGLGAEGLAAVFPEPLEIESTLGFLA